MQSNATLEDEMKIAIVGSREYGSLHLVEDVVREISQAWPDATIVSGGARGVDATAERAALRYGLRTRIFPADWERYGKSAGYRRNVEIVSASEVVYAFQAHGSRGTQHTIDIATAQDKPVVVWNETGKIVRDDTK